MSVKKPAAQRAGHTRSKHTGAATAHADLTIDHQSIFDVTNVGWGTFEARFQELMALLSAPTSGLNANQARQQQKANVSNAITALLDMAQQECRRLLIEGNAKAAVEGGLKTLKLKEEYYGAGSLQLVPAYFHLARTNQYMDKFKAAEEFLSLAQWTILRHPNADVSLKAELHQTFGLLYASDGKLDAALKQLTCATYYLCNMNGPEHVLTSFGYFDLGNVFAAKSNMENTMAFYDKVKEIWYVHLNTILRPQSAEAEAELETMQFATPASFGEENLQDAVKMLRGIVGLQTERYGRVHPSTARAEQVLGMFMLWNGDAVTAMNSLLKALEICKRVYGDRHPATGEIRSLMLHFGLQVPEDTSGILDDQAQAAGMVEESQLQQEEHQQQQQQQYEQAKTEQTPAAHEEEATAETSPQNVEGEEAEQDETPPQEAPTNEQNESGDGGQ